MPQIASQLWEIASNQALIANAILHHPPKIPCCPQLGPVKELERKEKLYYIGLGRVWAKLCS